MFPSKVGHPIHNFFYTLLLIPFILILIHLYYIPQLQTTLSKSFNECIGKYIYIQNIPSQYNTDLVRDCNKLSQWTDMCMAVTNTGLGPNISNINNGWYNTNQFTLEIIFHNRMKHYKCLTTNSSQASAIFIPFYAGLDVGRHLWGADTSVRDSNSMELLKWVKSRPEWQRMGGKDHFLVAGRVTWDFRRIMVSGWGNNFLNQPETQNITTLIIESSPWHTNDFAIPYPTYFHPSTKNEILTWQEKVRNISRKYLFSFAGAPRLDMSSSIRQRIFEQCGLSKRCKLLDCRNDGNECFSATSIMKLFESSIFCLQPKGDSYTRRSTFDAMVSGCIPVFFDRESAYFQYKWYLPKNYTLYSVFVPEDVVNEGKVKLEELLSEFTKEEVIRMREEVIKMIPKLIYGDPRVELEGWKDAFDVAIERVIERVGKIRSEMKKGELIEALGE
ncbi:Exostosin-like protein [Dioscorea alata]|uniref:Exostosin-like protein n=1 Tax=Dioscorea alata TaxID=55571 RepID=A0ACB7UYY1_DIOAL|nr:Exostosin-like protein [Dioscorea alata]